MVKIVEIKPHPNSDEFVVVVFQTKVRHELVIPKELKDDKDKIVEEIKSYLKGKVVDGVKLAGYEELYPQTKDSDTVE